MFGELYIKIQYTNCVPSGILKAEAQKDRKYFDANILTGTGLLAPDVNRKKIRAFLQEQIKPVRELTAYYAALAGVLTAFCAIIPYVGAFLSGVVSVFLTLVVDPTLAVRCLVIYLVIQFIETQFIYPRVVGGSMGLSPLYTLVAALIGGELFGILGMIFFIPLSAVVIEVIKADTQKRLSVRNISIE